MENLATIEKLLVTVKSKKFLATLIFGSAFWVGAVLYFTAHYTIGLNLTPSLPYRFICIHKGFTESDLKKDGVIGFKFGFDSRYDNYKKGTLFSKRIECMPGDTLTTVGRNHLCNGEMLYDTALTIDSKGKPIPDFFEYNGTIPEGKYYVKGDHSHSYDSRYWGFVDKSQIVGAMAWGY